MGIYDFFENKWYDFIEWLDNYVPATKLVDKIDKKVPSFVLFLALVLFIFIIFFLLLMSVGQTNKVELVVLSSTGLPLADVSVLAMDDCLKEFDTNTDEKGIVLFEVCSTSLEVSAEKNGYSRFSGNVEAVDGKAVIKLSPLVLQLSSRDFHAEVVDKSSSIIEGASLELNCINDSNKSFFTNQSTNGFDLVISSKCNPAQLKASATGYQEKVATIKQTDERMIITLEEVESIGKVFFKANGHLGAEAGAEISYTNIDTELRSTVFTDSGGYRLVELKAGDYTYSATSIGGQTTQGIFTIGVNENKDVLVNFPAPVDNADYLFLRVVSENGTPIQSAKIEIFKDGNFLNPKSTDSNGKTSPLVAAGLTPSTKYVAFVSFPGYESAISIITPRKITAEPSEIKLRQGGAKIKVRVMDDLNILQKDAAVALKYAQHGITIYSKLTDANGEVLFSELPQGSYSLRAVDSTQKAEATAEKSISKDSINNIEMILVTGEGKIKFKFLNTDYTFESPSLKLFGVVNGTKNLLAETVAKAGVYETAALKTGTKIMLQINDANYIPTQTQIYEISRKNQEKEVYLVRAGSLTNTNKVQMKLIQIYSSNPSYGTPSKATQILAGQSYYIQLLTILNNDSQSWSVSDFFMGPQNKNTLDANSIASVGEIYSINTANNFLSSVNNGAVIDPLSGFVVDSFAKQGNSQLGSVLGPFVVPVVVRVDVDVNKRGSFDVFFRGLHGTEQSLLYSKSFTIGEKFCLSDCPIFLFSNFVKGKSNEFEPVTEDPFVLLVGDDYTLKTIVKNSIDTDFGAVVLSQVVPKESMENILLADKNSFSSNINLLPLASATVEAEINTLKAGSSSEKIIQTIEKISGGVNQFRDYEGNGNTIKFSVKAKEQLEIGISPTQIEEKFSYPLFIVKTKYKGKKPVSAHWSAWKLDSEGLPVVQINYGTTDANGIQITTFDASGLVDGDKVKFTVYDDNGALDGNLIVNVVSSVPITVPPLYECLTPKIDGVNLFRNPNYYVRIPVNGGVQIAVDSNCTEDRIVYINTDLAVSEKQFTVPKNGSKAIILGGTPRDNLLGAYPVQIIAVGSSRYTQLALTDVDLYDSNSCFDLNQAVFDLTYQSTASGKINNKCFSGRKDNFYPKVDLSTKSVGLTYNKPGNPANISFTAKVVGSAVEALVSGFAWAEMMHQKSYADSCNSTIVEEPAPEEFFFTEIGENNCDDVTEEIQNREADPKEEPEIDATNPSKPFYALPQAVQKAIISEIFPESGSNSSIGAGTASTSSAKEKKVTFETLVGGEEIDFNPNANGYGPSKHGFEFYPSTIGNPLTPQDESCSLPHPLVWVNAPDPEGYLGGCGATRSDLWCGEDELPYGILSLQKTSVCNPCILESYGLITDGLISGFVYTRGEEDDGFLGTGLWGGSSDAHLMFQPEFYRVITFMQEVQNEWEKDFNISTTEGAVQLVGRYDAAPVPIWTKVSEAFEHDEGDEWEEDDLLMTNLCIQPMGFIPPETADGSNGPYDVGDYTSPLIEYGSGGMVKYYIPPESIPANTRAFLKGGKYYIEYFGAPQIDSPNIDFTLTRNNLLGTEYAIITVQDWTRGDTKEVKQFQVKLKGPPSNCYSPEGIAGLSGEEFRPRLLFNWNWSSIAVNQCDMSNENYTYCDATQFTISIFKKLVEIQSLIQTGRISDLPSKTAFYAYLIKDNYSTGFLNDFDSYYSSNISEAASYFNTTSITQGYDQFISRNKISFVDKNTNLPLLPMGGLYRVEINIDFDKDDLFSLFDNNIPNANIKIVMDPVMLAQNYNPFYETPFDGELGRDGENYVRKGYGVSIVGGELKLNASVKARDYSDVLKRVNYSSTNNLSTMQNAPILYYQNGGDLRFNPSQPTPVIMKITGASGQVNAQYSISGTGANTAPNKEWKLVSSSISSGGKCADFENNNKIIFNEVALDSGRKALIWNGQKAGTIGLSTTFFTPKSVPETLRITSANDAIVSFTSYPNLKNSNIIMLNNYDSKGVLDYDSLEGLFGMISEEKVCISQNSFDTLRIWWNPDYLDSLIKEVNTNKSYSCK